ncbi:hypothetical protein D3Z52_09670 [Clostridiaceae bacterium]|nr:hypothetical protein [Clostridiaceae bacterium]
MTIPDFGKAHTCPRETAHSAQNTTFCTFFRSHGEFRAFRGLRRGSAPNPGPARAAPGLCPWTPALRGLRRGSAPGPRPCAGCAGALPLDPGPARAALGLCPRPRPCAGSARGTRPSGLPFSPAGGTEDWFFSGVFKRLDRRARHQDSGPG